MGNRFYFSVGKVRTYAHSIFKTSGGWWLIKTQMAPFGTQMFSDVISGTKDTITRIQVRLQPGLVQTLTGSPIGVQAQEFLEMWAMGVWRNVSSSEEEDEDDEVGVEERPLGF